MANLFSVKDKVVVITGGTGVLGKAIAFVYDKSFWEDFNVIPPEKELSEAIEKISSKIEETEN